jgi:ubiquinone/menaquinone biosynthesis C-methylase UbiE/uncharacterized membrane protein YbhN (UPF0104 family)
VLLLVLTLSIALSAGASITYVWLTETGGWSLIEERPLPLLGAAAVAVCLTLLNLLVRWLRWNFLLRRFHVRVPTRETFQLFFATLAAIMTPFYLGELLRGAMIARRHRELLPVVFWVWLVERCSDVAALLVIWGLSAGRPTLWAAGVLLLLAAPWVLAQQTLRRPGVEKLHTGQLRIASIVLFCGGSSLLAWSLPTFAMQTVLRAFDVHEPLALAGEAFSGGTLLGGISGAPGGLGAVGSAMIVALITASVPAPVAAASVLVMRFATQWFATALGIVLAATWRRSLVQLFKSPASEQQHFDALATSYADDIPEHVRQRLLRRKIDAMLSKLPAVGAGVSPRGLDLGCGQAWYAVDLARRGYTMHGIDLSHGQIAQAKKYCFEQGAVDLALATYDGTHIPYADGLFDFAYSINVLHHVTDPGAQTRLLAEVLRVLKPGGVFLLHEMNVENALFRGYMSYVFPLLKRIDEGTELWIRPTRLPYVPGGTWQSSIAYFTFLPEFLPHALLRMGRPLERWLESSSFSRYGAHYMATLERES